MTEEKLLQKLINIPSVSGQEAAILKWIEKYLTDLGLETQKAGENLGVKIAGWDKKAALIFNAHVDTVKGSLDRARVKGGRVVGLGASDEKSTVAVLLKLAEKLVRKPPECDVWLTFVVKEEIDGSGSETLVVGFKKLWRKYKQAAVVLGEPTGLSMVANQNKGNIFVEATVEGDGGHGANPGVVKTKAIQEMYKLSQEIKTKWQGNMTAISAGEVGQPNKFPTKCTAVFDIRTKPGNHEAVLRWIKVSRKAEFRFIYPPAAPGFTDPEQKVVRAAVKLIGGKTGSFPGSTDLCFFTNEGIPGIIIGPGELKQMHKPGEYCLVSKLRRATQVYLDLIHEFSVVE